MAHFFYVSDGVDTRDFRHAAIALARKPLQEQSLNPNFFHSGLFEWKKQSEL